MNNCYAKSAETLPLVETINVPEVKVLRQVNLLEYAQQPTGLSGISMQTITYMHRVYLASSAVRSPLVPRGNIWMRHRINSFGSYLKLS